jgi:DNA polymerase I - 3''-5'' exonuclease and polymerase domains
MSLALPRVWLFADYNQAESRVVAWKGPVPKLKQRYQEGVDVHSYVCNLIARVVQENNISTPINPETGKRLFRWKDHGTFGKGDEEREIAKRAVHAGNYGEGVSKFALRTGLAEDSAAIVKKIYETLFPEIKTNYQAWVERCIRKNKTICTPEPVKFRKIFYDIVSDDLMRQAYAAYPQYTIGAMLNRTIKKCCRIFIEDTTESLKDQWKAWYGDENWDNWRHLRDSGLRTPQAILWSGMDVRLNIHDAGGISIPNDPDLIRWAATRWKEIAETPIQVHENETMIVPVDFKTGATWGAEDQKDYKL